MDGRQTELAVGGMNCANCAARIGKALHGVPGVEKVDVRVREGRVTVRHGGGVTLDQLVEAVERAGYRTDGR